MDYALDEDGAAFGLICEFPGQDPILMEMEGHQTTREAIDERLRNMGQRPMRWLIVRLTPTDSGNKLLFKDLLRMQK